jgi:hypothetical protein
MDVVDRKLTKPFVIIGGKDGETSKMEYFDWNHPVYSTFLLFMLRPRTGAGNRAHAPMDALGNGSGSNLYTGRKRGVPLPFLFGDPNQIHCCLRA